VAASNDFYVVAYAIRDSLVDSCEHFPLRRARLLVIPKKKFCNEGAVDEQDKLVVGIHLRAFVLASEGTALDEVVPSP